MVGTWVLVAALFRYSSLSALVATLLAPVYAGWLTGAWPLVATTAAMTLLIFWRHQGNIQRLWRGEEGKIGAKKDAAAKS